MFRAERAPPGLKCAFIELSRLAVTLLAVIDSSQGAVLDTAAGHTTRRGFSAAGGKCLKNGLGSAFIPM